MRIRPKMNRYERRQFQAVKYAADMGGSGLFVFENNTDADLTLPKPTSSGVRTVGPRKRFQGDSYYLKLVGHPMNLLRLIEEMKPTEKIAEENMNEQKLILDQPDTVTPQGKVEHVVAKNLPVKPLNDSTHNKPSPDVLITENPLEGVEIIKG